MQKTVLITGATGKQGGAVARHLRDSEFAVRALVRDACAPAAQKLSAQGVQLAVGDFDDAASLQRALEGVYGAFSVQTFAEDDIEHEQGAAFADAAQRAGVAHLVYSSVGSADRNTGVPHFDTKGRVEAHLAHIGLPHTVLRPVFLMENWERMRPTIEGGVLPQPLAPTRFLQQVSVEDIGAFAALALREPQRWIGQAVDIAGDEATMTEIAQTFGRVLGREVRYLQTPFDEFERQAGAEMTTMYRWFETVGYSADVAACRTLLPSLMSLEDYLRANDWAPTARGERK